VADGFSVEITCYGGTRRYITITIKVQNGGLPHVNSIQLTSSQPTHLKFVTITSPMVPSSQSIFCV